MLSGIKQSINKAEEKAKTRSGGVRRNCIGCDFQGVLSKEGLCGSCEEVKSEVKDTCWRCSRKVR